MMGGCTMTALYIIFCIVPAVMALIDSMYNGSGWY